MNHSHLDAEGLRGALCVLLAALTLLAVLPREAHAQSRAEAPTHTVRRGDTLYSLARRYGLTVEQLQRLNGLSGTNIRVGQELIVQAPGASAPPEEEAPSAEAPPPETLEENPPGEAQEDSRNASESPSPEAPLPEVSAADTATTPPPDPPATEPDTAVALPDAAATPSTESASRGALPSSEGSGAEEDAPLTYGSYTVPEGQGATLYDIAYRYGTTADTLRALNADLSTFLRPGQTLRLPPSLAAPTHRVAEGETLYDVAAEYGVSVRSLQQANGLDERDVSPGQRLRIPGRRAPEPEPRASLPPITARGAVQVYPEAFEGRLMAGGSVYDPGALTVSHPNLPFGAVVLLENPATGQRTLARVADRGPLDEAFLMDVSAAVARRLGLDPARSEETAIALRPMQ